MKRRLLSMLLVLTMLLSLIPTAVFAVEVEDSDNDGTINYVSFGASNVNGYGLAGYLDEDVTAANKATANVYCKKIN